MKKLEDLRSIRSIVSSTKEWKTDPQWGHGQKRWVFMTWFFILIIAWNTKMSNPTHNMGIFSSRKEPQEDSSRILYILRGLHIYDEIWYDVVTESGLLKLKKTFHFRYNLRPSTYLYFPYISLDTGVWESSICGQRKLSTTIPCLVMGRRASKYWRSSSLKNTGRGIYPPGISPPQRLKWVY